MTNTNERPAEEREDEVLELGLAMIELADEKEKGNITAQGMQRLAAMHIRTLLSRTRKDATEEAWKGAVRAVPEEQTKTDNECCIRCAAGEERHKFERGYERGWNSARQQLIQAAKESGVNPDICEK